MRTAPGTLDTDQKDASLTPAYQVVLSGPASATYTASRVLTIVHTETPWSQTAEIVLNNSDGAVTDDFRGAKAVVSYGVGANLSPCAPLYVVNQIERSEQGLLVVSLMCHGLSDRLALDQASVPYKLDPGDTQTVKTLLTAIVGATLPPFQHCKAYTATYDSEDSLVDVFTPAEDFVIDPSGITGVANRLDAIRLLLSYTKNVMRPEDDGEIHFRQPTVSGVSYDEEYRVNVSGQHELLSKSTTKRFLIPNFIVVQSHPDDSDSYHGSAEDTASSDVTDGEFREHFFISGLASDAQADLLAAAYLEGFQLAQQQGSAIAPMNCLQECWDYILLTDSRAGDTLAGNVGYIRREVHGPRSGGVSRGRGGSRGPRRGGDDGQRWLIHLSLGADRSHFEGSAYGVLAGRTTDDIPLSMMELFWLQRDMRRILGRPSYSPSQDYAALRLLDRLQIPVGSDLFGMTGLQNGSIGSQVDTLNYETNNGQFPDIVHVKGDVFAVASLTSSSDLIVSTFTIDKDGNIGAAAIDTQSIDTGTVETSRILKVADGVFAVFYIESGGGTVDISTITINDDGTIDNSAIDTLQLYSGVIQSVAQIDAIRLSTGNYWAVVFPGAANDGFVYTIDIDNVGNIGAAAVDFLEFDTSHCEEPSIVNVSGDIYAIAYRDATTGIKITTVDIDSTGVVANATVDSQTLSTVTAITTLETFGKIIKVSAGVFALPYADTDGDGQLITIAITPAGAVTTTVLDSLEFDTADGTRPRIISVGSDLYAITYTGVANDGFIVTVRINVTGSIANAVVDSLEFDTTGGFYCSPILVPASNGVVAIVYYRDGATFGHVVTHKAVTLFEGFIWIEGSSIHYYDENGVEQAIFDAQDRTFHVNTFEYPAPGADWTPELGGAGLAQSLSAKKVWLPLNFLKVGDIITSYTLKGDASETTALTLDCKLVKVTKADPPTTSDVGGGAIAQVTSDGAFAVTATLTNEETVAADTQYKLEIQGTTSTSDTILVTGAEVAVKRL